MAETILTRHDIDGDLDLTCDVCIVGSGAGGAVLAAGLAERGLDVIVLEEGGYYTREDFDAQEAWSYPTLYQERGARGTADLAITILQGRNVGGGTTVNWTTCFRTPDRILNRWAERWGVDGLTPDVLRPHFEAVEERLGIAPWEEERVNANNRVLLDGCRALDLDVEILRRNVRGCANTGFCGLGCPVDAKQGMAITYLLDAVQAGARVYANCRVDRIEVDGDRVVALHGTVIDSETDVPTGQTVRVRPRVAVSSAGAINGPALLLRSNINPNGRVGLRTLLHPVVALPARYEHRIDGFYGAPQSVSSHHFTDRGPDRVGFFLETPPLQPMLLGSAGFQFGRVQQQLMSQLPHLGALIAICVDGWVEGDEGGVVSLRNDGRVRIDYPFSAPLQEAFREAHQSMARIELAAGAIEIQSSHVSPVVVRSEADIAAFADAPFGPLDVAVFTAHQMGGCTMGADPNTSVVDSTFRHHHVHNLYVVDGSVFPTALGVNPSETIYGLAHYARELVAAAV